MPRKNQTQSVCVLYALLISASCASVVSGQGYAESEQRPNRQFGGMVDQLSRGQTPVIDRRPPLGESYQPLRSESFSDPIETQLRTISGSEDAVTLRPQPMSVQQASFESNDPRSAYRSLATGQPQNYDRLNAEQDFQSFIERENSVPAPEKADASEFVSRIALNLVFVLALAFAGLLIIRQFQKGKASARNDLPSGLNGLKIDQVLQVTRGVSLYLVDSMASKILVAVDGGGIKSVNVLPARFEDELDEPEAFSRQREPESTRSATNLTGRQTSRRSVNKTSTSEIDENLIKLLLTKSREAA